MSTEVKSTVVKRHDSSKKKDNGYANASVTRDETGQTIIRDQVVAKIVGLAVREIQGVHKLVPYGASQSVASLAKTVTGSSMRDLGVHVEVGKEECAVDMRIIADYGVSLPSLAEAIRRNVSDRVSQMTGLQTIVVNVDVVDLYFPDEDDEDA